MRQSYFGEVMCHDVLPDRISRAISPRSDLHGDSGRENQYLGFPIPKRLPHKAPGCSAEQGYPGSRSAVTNPEDVASVSELMARGSFAALFKKSPIIAEATHLGVEESFRGQLPQGSLAYGEPTLGCRRQLRWS